MSQTDKAGKRIYQGDQSIYEPMIRLKKGSKPGDEKSALLVDDMDAPVDRRITGKVTLYGKLCLPQGDPEAANNPRVDPVTGEGFITPQGTKRHVRDYIGSVYGDALFVARGSTLAAQVDKVAKGLGINAEMAVESGDDEDSSEEESTDAPEGPRAKAKADAPKDATKAKTKVTREEADAVILGLTRTYYDVRAFGAVLTKPYNRGVRGPVQIHFAISHDPVEIIDFKITRCAVASEKEAKSKDRTMGDANVIRFGLYSFPFSVNPTAAMEFGFTWKDLNRMLSAFRMMWDEQQSTLRNNIHVKQIVLFAHEGLYGSCPEKILYDAIKISRRTPHGEGSPLSIEEYDFRIDRERIPATVTTVVSG